MNTNLENGGLFASLRVKRRLVLQHRDQDPDESIGKAAQCSCVLMAGSSQAIILLPAGFIADDASGCPMMQGLS